VLRLLELALVVILRVGAATIASLNRFIAPMQLSCCRFVHSAIGAPDWRWILPPAHWRKSMGRYSKQMITFADGNAGLLMSDQVLNLEASFLLRSYTELLPDSTFHVIRSSFPFGSPCIYARGQVKVANCGCCQLRMPPVVYAASWMLPIVDAANCGCLQYCHRR
jgi:hypothetical protein